MSVECFAYIDSTKNERLFFSLYFFFFFFLADPNFSMVSIILNVDFQAVFGGFLFLFVYLFVLTLGE